MTRRTAFNGSASGRRRERRAALQSAVAVSAVAVSAEKMHRPTLSRAQIQAKGTHETPKRIDDAKPLKFMAQDAFWNLREYKLQIERATILYSNEFGNKPLEGGMCLPDVAIYAAGHRKSKSITAR
ncbi:antitermination protein [Enterobacter hormaechei]